MLLLTNASVFAPEALGIRHVLIAGERIVWMGESRPELPAALNVETLDLEGRRLIPGFVDCHTHLTGGGGEAGYASRVPPLALTQLTRAGVTTAVGLLGTDDTVRTTAELLAATRALREEGLSAWCWTGGYHLPPQTLTGSVRGDIVHLGPVIGAGEIALSDHRSSQPTREELLRLASDCHVGGLMTDKAGVLHLHLGDGERGLSLIREALAEAEIPARVYHPTHVNRRAALLEEAFALVTKGCTIDVTAFPEDGGEGVSAHAALARYLDAGLPARRITVSSDGGGCLPAFDEEGRVSGMDVGTPATLAETLRSLLAEERALEEILPAFTSNPARHLRLGRKGLIAVGADADLVVLDEGHEVVDVMARGAWFVRAGRVVKRGTFEGP